MKTAASLMRNPIVIWASISFGGAVLITALAMGWLSNKYGSLGAARAYLRGQQLILLPTSLDFGEGEPGELVDRQIQAINLTDRPVTLLGARTSCGCMIVDQLPIKISGGGKEWISVKMRLLGGSEIVQSLTFYYDLPGDGCVSVSVKGKVREASAASR